jgi:hypothetical protein
VETLRGLMLGTPAGHDAPTGLAWCAGPTLLGCVSAGRLFRRAA